MFRMSLFNKQIYVFLFAVLISVVFEFVYVNSLFSYLTRTTDYSKISLEQLTPVNIDIKDKIYSHEDPQFLYNLPSPSYIHGVIINFHGLSNQSNFQVFYSKKENSFSERRSSKVSVEQSQSSIFIPINSKAQFLRFDIGNSNENYFFDSIEINPNILDVLDFKLNFFRFFFFFLGFYVFLFIILHRKQFFVKKERVVLLQETKNYLKRMINELDINNIMFLSINACFILMLLISSFNMSTIGFGFGDFYNGLEDIFIYLRVVLIILFLIAIFKDFRKDLLVLFICFMSIFFFSYTTKENWMLFDLFFIPLFLKNYIHLKLFNNLYFYILIFITFLVVTLDYCNVLPHIIYNDSSRGINNIRYNLGFAHPNTLGCMLFLISCLFVIRKNNLKIPDFLFLILIAIFCYVIPNSITAALSVFLLSIICFIFNVIRNRISYSFKKIIFYLYILMFFSSVTVVYYVVFSETGKNIIESLPGSLWARFSLGLDAIDSYGFHLFGQPVQETGTIAFLQGTATSKFFVIDSTFFYLPIVLGIIPTIVFILLYLLSVKKIIDKENWYLLSVFLVVLFYSISENYIVTRFLFMFLFVNSLYVEKKDLDV